MNPVERILEGELLGLIDRLAASLPPGAVRATAGTAPAIKSRLDEAEARLADVRAALLADYGRWRRALEDLENLWALAAWRSAAQEPVEKTSTLAA